MTDIKTALVLIQRNFPKIKVQTALPITRGWDSFVLEVNGELIFRFPMREDVSLTLEQLAALAPALATFLNELHGFVLEAH